MPVLDLIPKKKKAARPPAPPPVVFPRYEPPLVPSGHPVPPRLARTLTELSQRYVIVNGTERVTEFVTIALILLSVQMFLDWLVDLPVLARAVILVADLGLLVFFVRRQLLPLIQHPPTLETCALMMEKQWPLLRGRMIAAIQLAQPRFTTDSPELVGVVQKEAGMMTNGLDFAEVVPTHALKRRAKVALAVAGVGLILMICTAPGSFALLERVFLIPAKVPRQTEVICLTGNKIIAIGDSLLIEAQAKGVVPTHGRLTLTDDDSGRIQEITLEPERNQPDHFSLTIDRVEEPLSYVIRLNDGTSETFHVKTVPRPNITSIDCEQVYPAYTGLGTVKRTVGNLALLAGSRLKIHAVANSTIVQASLKLAGMDMVIPMPIGGADSNDLTGVIDIPASGLTGFSIELTNQAGIASGDATEYRIDIIPDHPPAIQLTYPDRLKELCTLKAKPTIAFVASDDYGLAEIALCYRVVPPQDAATGIPAEPEPVKRIEMDLGQGHPLNMKNRYEWDLAACDPPLAEETTLEYWMEARDANNVTGPGVSESEHHTIKIVSDSEKRAEVMARLMDSLSNITDISQNQEKINQDLGAVIQSK